MTFYYLVRMQVSNVYVFFAKLLMNSSLLLLAIYNEIEYFIDKSKELCMK